MTGGLIWASYWVRAFLLSSPTEEWGDAIGIAMLCMVISAPGEYLAPFGRRIGLGIGGVIAGLVLSRTLPWDIGDGVLNGLAGVASFLIAGAGLLTLAAIRAGVGRTGQWILIAGAVIAPIVIALPIVIGVGPQTRDAAVPLLFALLPYGLAWSIMGLRMAVRGSATFPDQHGPLGPGQVPA